MIHYGTGDLSDLPKVVRETIEDLRPHRDEFDSITTSGTSGMLVASPVALALGKELVVVRKRDEGPRCWHANDVENARNAGRRTLFLDDEVQRGRTLKHVREMLRAHTTATVTARYEYYGRKYTDETYQEARRPHYSDVMREYEGSRWTDNIIGDLLGGRNPWN